ncbi:MAG: hypothetical protein ACR2PX_05915, partial [Endozoicomonas sp.]
MPRRTQSDNCRSDSVKKRIDGHLETLNLFAAGIDIGSVSHFVAVPKELSDHPVREQFASSSRAVREFSCFTADLEAMAEWLVKSGITTAVMESTGVYWIPA